MVQKLLTSKEWGKRRLAYEINDLRDGYYNNLKRKLLNSEAVKNLTV